MGDVVRSGNPDNARSVIVAMQEHMRYGHPDDVRNKAPVR